MSYRRKVPTGRDILYNQSEAGKIPLKTKIIY